MAKDSIPYNSLVTDTSRIFSGNPISENTYDLFTGDSAVIQIVTGKDNPKAEMRYTGDSLPFSLAKSDSIFIFFFLCFILFTRIYKESFVYLKENVALLFSFSKSHPTFREVTTKEAWFSYFLILQTVVLISISLYDSFLEYIPIQSNTSSLLVIGSFIGLILLFILVKYIWYKVFGYIFEMEKSINILMQTGINIFEILGILFFIPVLLLIYLEYWHLYIMSFILILFLISQIMYFIRIIVYFVKEKFSFLFLFAYLCTVEIIPYFFLIAGLIYLYKIDLFNVVTL